MPHVVVCDRFSFALKMVNVDVDDSSFNTFKQISAYFKIAAGANGLLIQRLNYNDVRRLISIDGTDVTQKGEDTIAKLLNSDLEELCNSELIDPKVSLASLFETGQLQRSLRSKIYMAYDIHDEANFVGVLVSCNWLVDDDLGTARFTNEFCLKAGIPDLTHYTFIDIFCSSRAPAATLMVIACSINGSRMRPPIHGLCAIAINKRARDVFAKLGFTVYQFREKNQTRWFCHITLAAFANLKRIMERVRFSGHTALVTKLCNRMSITKPLRIVHRC